MRQTSKNNINKKILMILIKIIINLKKIMKLINNYYKKTLIKYLKKYIYYKKLSKLLTIIK
jgi:hypothetical protein